MVAAIRVLDGARIRFVLLRYAVAAIVALEALYVARLLGPGPYGELGLLQQSIAALTAMVSAGGSGYVARFFREDCAALDEAYATGSVLLALVVAGILAALVEAGIGGPYQYLPLLFIPNVMYVVAEPILRVRGHLQAPTVARGVASALSIAILAAAQAMHGTPQVRLPFGWAAAGAAVSAMVAYLGLAAFAWRAVRTEAPRVLLRHPRAAFWRDVFAPGLSISAAGLFFTLFANVDRIGLERRGADALLGSLGLAVMLAQGAALALSSTGAYATVRHGQLFNATVEERRAAYWQELRSASFVGALTFCFLTAGAVVLATTWYREYPSLIPISMLMGAGFIGQGVAGSVTPILVVNLRLSLLTVLYGALVVIAAGAHVAGWAWNWPLLVAPSIGVVSLLAVSLALVRQSFLTLDAVPSEAPDLVASGAHA